MSDSRPFGSAQGRLFAKNAKERSAAGGPDLELPKLTQLWVPRPSRTLRRARTGLPTVNCFGSKDSNEPVRTYTVGSIVPALAQPARTGHRSFRTGKKNGA